MASSDTILISAPGKVILHGEHAVVYGKPALAASVDLRCYALLQSSEIVTLDLPDLGLCRSWSLAKIQGSTSEETLAGDEEGPRGMATRAFIHLLTQITGGNIQKGLSLTVCAGLPPGAGLGSSAAYSVCVATALLIHTGALPSPATPHPFQQLPLPQAISRELKSNSQLSTDTWAKHELEIINKWAFEAEKLVHGKPSGIDNSISTFGGAIHFQAGKITHLERMAALKVLLVNTKVPRSTKLLVEKARQRKEKYPAVVEPIMEAIAGIVECATELYTSSHDRQQMDDLIEMNQCLLNAIGAGHSSLDKVCSILAAHGLKAKLTGAGGGGCAIALLSEDSPLDLIRGSLCEEGFECWSTTVGAIGVCMHKTSEDTK